MIRAALVLMLGCLLSACHLPTFPERPSLISNQEHPLATQTAAKAVLLWLPQTQSSELSSYRLAVQYSLTSLASDPELLERSQGAQQQLDQSILALGGLYDGTTGRFNSAVLAQALEQTYAFVQTEMPAVTDVVLINLDRQSVMVRNGVARWDHVQQKVMDQGGSVRYVNAVSLQLSYLLPDEQRLTERFGLDIQPAPIGPHQRYDRVLQRAFAPYL